MVMYLLPVWADTAEGKAMAASSNRGGAAEAGPGSIKQV
jgi:hypothetical protein